ncbi:MAG: hypothetical protein U0R78_18345 [Nocardioidaceae bacterium]
MVVVGRVESMTPEELAPVVKRATGVPGAWPTQWTCRPLATELVNPVTVGVFRVDGRADAPGRPDLPWTVVLKVVTDVSFGGSEMDVGYSHEPQDWNYWNREAHVFRSGFLEDLPGPLAAVRCWGCEAVSDDESWIWLEALEGAAPRRRWSLDELADAAYDLGAFGAQGLGRVEEIESHAWAARRWLRGWVGSSAAFGARHAADHEECWRHPLLESVLPSATRARYLELMADSERMLATVESFPRTVAHHDAQWSNLFHPDNRADARTVAIDWSFLGSAPVGHDLGTHLSGTLCNWGIDPREAAAHDATATAAYLQGLRDFGWTGEEREVVQTRAIVVSLQMSTFFAAHLSWICDDLAEDDDDAAAWPAALAEREGLSVEEAMTAWAAGFDHVLSLGDEARV